MCLVRKEKGKEKECGMPCSFSFSFSSLFPFESDLHLNNRNQKKQTMSTDPIIVERTFNVPVSKVWDAITDKNEMKAWYFDLVEFKPEEGFRFEFTGGPSPEKQYKHLCEVTEVIPIEKLVYSWRYEGYAGISHVSFELFETGAQTLVRLTHSGIESFPKDNPDLAVGNFIEGWNDIIHKNLKGYLEGESNR
jgi:uncharacterized protein YndB with AHSA1/START domain